MNTAKPLICIIGASGTGKTSLANLLARRYGVKQVASVTDRPMREGERNGTDHVFDSPSWFDEHRSDLVAYTVFDGCQYGVTKEMLNESGVYVLDIPGLRELKDRYQERTLIVVGLYAPEKTRAERMLKRGDPEDKVSSRILHDRKAFEGLGAVSDILVDASGNLNLVYMETVDRIHHLNPDL